MKPRYKLTVGKTYYNKGFFNLGVEVERFVRQDDGPIRIWLGDATRYVDGRVTRSANQNGTPRVFGGADLRDWLQANCRLGGSINVAIEEPDLLRLIPN